MTLLEIIELNQNKYKPSPCSDFYNGYNIGWREAYRDLKEILERNNFDMNIIVVKKDT